MIYLNQDIRCVFFLQQRISNENNFLSWLETYKRFFICEIQEIFHQKGVFHYFVNTVNFNNRVLFHADRCSKYHYKWNSKYLKNVLWQSAWPKINHKTFCNTFEDGRLRNVDAKIKIINSQCSWTEKSYDDNFQERDIISLNLISKHFGKNFNFHSSLFFDATMVQNFSKVYKKSTHQLAELFYFYIRSSPCIFPNFLWYNKNILSINNKTVHIASFFNKSYSVIWYFWRN